MSTNEEFGSLVSRKRKNLNLTQEKLAEICNLSSRHIGNIECGKTNPTLKTALKLCEVCKINVGELSDID